MVRVNLGNVQEINFAYEDEIFPKQVFDLKSFINFVKILNQTFQYFFLDRHCFRRNIHAFKKSSGGVEVDYDSWRSSSLLENCALYLPHCSWISGSLGWKPFQVFQRGLMDY